MISEKLYELAFQYKKTNLWRKFRDTEIFAVKFSNGEIGYINIIEIDGDYNALHVHIGEKEYESYINVTKLDGLNYSSPFFYHEATLQQDCLQCMFVNKADLTGSELKKVRQYAGRNRIRLRGRSAYQRFKKYQTGYIPWDIQKKQDVIYLTEALKASVEMAKILEKKSLVEVGIREVTWNTDIKTIPMLEFKEDKFQIGSTDLPEIPPVRYIEPSIFNDIKVAKLRNMEKSGVWECELAQYPVPVQSKPNEIPHFLMMFLVIEFHTKFLLHVSPVEHFQENPEDLINIIVDAFLEQDVCPAFIRVRDERSYHFIKPLCKKLKTVLKIEHKLIALDEIECDLFNYLQECDYEDEDFNEFLLESSLVSEDEIDTPKETTNKKAKVISINRATKDPE